jgi:hypothetical protein
MGLACIDLFEDHSENSLKGGLSKDTTVNPPLFSLVNTFKPALAKRDKKQTMIDLRGTSTNWFENQLCPSIRLFILQAQVIFVWRS